MIDWEKLTKQAKKADEEMYKKIKKAEPKKAISYTPSKTALPTSLKGFDPFSITKFSKDSSDSLKKEAVIKNQIKLATEEKEKAKVNPFKELFKQATGTFDEKETAKKVESYKKAEKKENDLKKSYSNVVAKRYDNQDKNDILNLESVVNSKDFKDTVSKGKSFAQNKGVAFKAYSGNRIEWLNSLNEKDLDTDDKKYQYMTPQERNVYAYYIGKGDTKKANEYLSLLDRKLNAIQADTESFQTFNKTKEKGVLGKIGAGVGNALTQVANVAGLAEIADKAISNISKGENRPLDPNSPYFAPIRKSNATVEGITDGMSGVPKFITQAGLGAVNNIATVLTLREFAPAVMALQ
jgi:hypothetical protein